MAAPREIGNLYVRVGTNLSGLHTGLRTAFASVSSFARSVSAVTLGNVIAGGITGAISNMSGIFTGAIEAGSTLNETLSKTGVLLGKNAESAATFAKSLEAKGIGTQAEVLDSMLNSVNMLRNQGVSMAKSLELAQVLESRVGDVASQDNKDPKMIRENLAAAMAGEFQVLRKYGVNASAEEQQGTGVKTAQYVIEKFLKQTQRAEGDFSRTGMGFANLQRASDVRQNAASARVGQDLQLVGQAFQFFRGRFLQSILDIANSGAFRTLGDQLYRIVATLGIALEGAVPKVVNGLIFFAEWIANAMKPFMAATAIFQVFRNRLAITLLSIIEGLSKVAEKITFGLVKSIDTAAERADLAKQNQQIGPRFRADMEANRLRVEELKNRFMAGADPNGNGALDAVQNANAQTRMSSSALDSLLKGVMAVQKKEEVQILKEIAKNTKTDKKGVEPVTGKNTLAGGGQNAGKPAWGGFGA